MKIALIFSGFFRTFNFVQESLFENIIKELNPDIYFSSPKTLFAPPEHEVNEFHNMHSQNMELVNPSIFNYNLVSCELKHYDSKFYKDKINENNLSQTNQFNQYHWRILSQMDAVSSSVNLFKRHIEKNNLHYDLVILTRPDIKYYSKINIDKIDLDKLNYPLHSVVEGNVNTVSCPPSHSLNKPFNDQILISSQKNILIYHNIYENIMSYVKEDGVCFNPETLFGIHAQKNNIDFHGTDCVLYELWRHGKF